MNPVKSTGTRGPAMVRRTVAGVALALAASLLPGVAAPVTAAPVAPRYLLVAGAASSNIAVLGVDAAGGLTPVAGSPFSTGTGVLSVEITPDGQFVYLAQFASGAISGYRLGADGALTSLPGAQVDLGVPAAFLKVSPDGRRLFAAIGDVTNEIRSYDIGSAGQLTPTAAPPTRIDGLSTLSVPTISPDGTRMFVTAFATGRVSSFTIEPDARLTPNGAPVDAGTQPALPAVTPDGRFVYVSNEGSSDITGFAVQPDGSLVALPHRFPTGGTPHGTIITPDGRRMYVPAATGGTVSGFAIGDDGSLSPLPGSPYAGPGDPGILSRVVLGARSDVLYLVDFVTTHGPSRVHTYAIAPDGSLAPSGRPATDTGVWFSDGPTSLLTPGS